MSEQSGNYYFYVVNRFDCLIYEKDLIKQSPTGEKKVILNFILKTKVIKSKLNYQER